MTILRIAIKELKVFREPKMLLFMLATPILIMLILGTALTNAFNGNDGIGEIRILIQNEISDPVLTSNWESFIKEVEQAGMSFESTVDDTDALMEVQGGKYSGYMLITDEGIDYYGNSKHSLETHIVQDAFSAFVDRYKLSVIATDRDLDVQSELIKTHVIMNNELNESSNPANKQPRAMDYYAVAVTTMIILYSALTAGQLMDNERKGHTAIRLLASPITKVDIFIGKIMGAFILNALFIIIIVLFSKMVFGAYWGERLELVLLVLFSQIIFALGLGLGISYVIKGNAAGAVIMMIVQLEAFIGGAYFPVEEMTGFIGAISQMSPLRWTNHAVLQLIYAADSSGAILPILFNIGSAALLLLLAMVMMQRREGL